MPQLRDLTGQRFTRLLVLSRAEGTKRGKPRWLCQCDCGNLTAVQSQELCRGDTKSCGCLPKGRPRLPPISLRFWDQVDVRGPEECWPWLGARGGRDARGSLGFGGRTYLAHRVAWSLHHGRDPEFCILHTCDWPLCCNPAHLYEGTPADNTRDKLQAGRCRNGHTGPMTEIEELATRRCTN